MHEKTWKTIKQAKKKIERYKVIEEKAKENNTLVKHWKKNKNYISHNTAVFWTKQTKEEKKKIQHIQSL